MLLFCFKLAPKASQNHCYTNNRFLLSLIYRWCISFFCCCLFFLLSYSIFPAPSFTVFSFSFLPLLLLFLFFFPAPYTASFSFLHLLLFLLLFLSILSPLTIRFACSSFGLLLFYCLLFSFNYYCVFSYSEEAAQASSTKETMKEKYKTNKKRISR